MPDLLRMMLLAAGVLVAVQVAAAVISRRLGRWAVVDAAWAPGFAAVGMVGLVAGSGGFARRVILAILLLAWAVRITSHLWRRVTRSDGDDARYVAMAQGRSYPSMALRVFAGQGVLQWVISLPIQVAAVTDGPQWPSVGAAVVVVGALVAAFGIIFEAIGDAQLARHVRSGRGGLMTSGLWSWTRHPNYFGDACLWVGVLLISAATWPGVLTAPSTALMLYLLVFGSGARLLERHMAKRPGYEEYRRRTSGFIPLPPREPADRG